MKDKQRATVMGFGGEVGRRLVIGEAQPQTVVANAVGAVKGVSAFSFFVYAVDVPLE
jgi:hypothetical protein